MSDQLEAVTEQLATHGNAVSDTGPVQRIRTFGLPTYTLTHPHSLHRALPPATPPTTQESFSALADAAVLPCVIATGDALASLRREISAMDVQVRVTQAQVMSHLHRRTGMRRGEGDSGAESEGDGSGLEG